MKQARGTSSSKKTPATKTSSSTSSSQKTLALDTSSSNKLPSNTKAGSQKSRKFFVTFWRTKKFLWDEKIMKYACMCDDKCSAEHEGKWHGHYYVYYKNPRTWQQLKQHFGNDCHIEIPFSNNAVIDYIMGRGDHAESKSNFIEMGKIPNDNGKHFTIKEALETTPEQLLELPMRDGKMIMNIQKDFQKKNQKIKISDWYKKVEVIFITGPSGIGKSKKAIEILLEKKYEYFDEINHSGQFWNGISEECPGAAIYDDFRDSHLPASEFIKFIDYNKHNLNVKGGFIKNNYNLIIITSIQHPKEIYSNLDDEPRLQWLRRIKTIDLNPNNQIDIKDMF